ncbi:ATP-binding protein [Streptomyces sp. NPDC014773]|uniref:ATP-binding protein n=1 Tax=Streptomyces sp. NPDC014773 TaxID=3364908 RepID=UPI0036F99E88
METMGVDIATDRPPGTLAWVRDRARSFLEGLVPTLASEAADTVVLVVSELVTHALRHGGGTCALGLAARPDSIEAAVHDPSLHAPRTCAPDLDGGTGGFGRPMVNRLATATSVTCRASGGKTVSASLPR